MPGPIKRWSVMRIFRRHTLLTSLTFIDSSAIYHAIFTSIIRFRISFSIIRVTILRVINAVIVINRRFFFDNFAPRTRTSHGWAQENVDQQHDPKQNTKSDTKPHQPIRIAGAKSDPWAINSWRTGSWAGLSHENRGRRCDCVFFRPVKQVRFLTFNGRQLTFSL